MYNKKTEEIDIIVKTIIIVNIATSKVNGNLFKIKL